MSFLSCEEMLAAARSQNISLAEAILRSDLAESRLTEEASRHAMHHLWHVMEATSREYDPAQRSRSGLSGGDAAKVEQAHQTELAQPEGQTDALDISSRNLSRYVAKFGPYPASFPNDQKMMEGWLYPLCTLRWLRSMCAFL